MIGFFQQKDFVYAKKINDHSVEITYNGHADSAAQNQLKEQIKSSLSGYDLDFHDGHDHSHADQSHGEEHGHHGPTFVWDVHLTHKVDEHAHPVAHHTSGADQLVTMTEDGDIAFFDSGLRRFWSNLLVNGFFFFGITLGALFFLALHYATESGWGVVLLRVFEGIMSNMPIGMAVLLVVFLVGTFGGHHIYPWMDPELTTPGSDHFDAIIYGKKAYFLIYLFSGSELLLILLLSFYFLDVIKKEI